MAALEDKIVQRATAAVLNQIYEEDFLPGRSQRDALDALMVGIRETKGVNWVIDADIQSFDTVSHEWLILEHRVGDRRIIRLIQKWLRAGVLEGGSVTVSFLRFALICGRSRGALSKLKRKTRRDRSRAKLSEIKVELRRRRHHAIPQQGRWLQQVVRGFFAYHAVPRNLPAPAAFGRRVVELWWRTLKRRSQRDKITWRRARTSLMTGCRNRGSYIRGRPNGLPSNILGGSRVRESRTYGSVQGALSNGRPYRDRLCQRSRERRR